MNDLNPADIQGYLYQRLRAHQSFQWEKRWFVLSGSCLYGFKSKDSAKAACLIFLSGFTVAVANEVSLLNTFLLNSIRFAGCYAVVASAAA